MSLFTITSGIGQVDGDYIFYELATGGDGPVLKVSPAKNAAKKCRQNRISLYNDSGFALNRNLEDKLELPLNHLESGTYRLKFKNCLIFRFSLSQ